MVKTLVKVFPQTVSGKRDRAGLDGIPLNPTAGWVARGSELGARGSELGARVARWGSVDGWLADRRWGLRGVTGARGWVARGGAGGLRGGIAAEGPQGPGARCGTRIWSCGSPHKWHADRNWGPVVPGGSDRETRWGTRIPAG